MNATLIVVLLAVFVMGVLLALLGRRGRKLNDHPQCRGCGFDLAGVYPTSPTCPECGAGLKRDGGVRNGVRKRMPLLVVAGVLLALLPVAPMAALVYAAVTGTNITRYTPVGVLLWQTRISSPEVNRQIANELTDRLIKMQLDKAQSASVAERVLALQADRSFAWDEAWGDVIERLNLNGDLTAEQNGRFLKQAVSLKGRCRATVHAGDTLLVLVETEPGRVGTKTHLLVSAITDSAKIGQATLGKKAATRSYGQQADLVFSIEGTKPVNSWGGGYEHAQAVSFSIPADLAPGPQTLTVTLLSRANDLTSGWNGGMGNGKIKATDPAVTSTTITLPVEVVAPGSELIKRIPATPEQDKALQSLFKQSQVVANITASGGSIIPFLGGMSISRTVQFQLTVDTAPMPFAFDVFVRLNGKETRLGEIASVKAVRSGDMYDPSTGFGQVGNAVFLSATVPNLTRSDRKLDLIFRPSTKAAMSTIELSAIYGGEIVLTDFQVSRNAETDTALPADTEPKTAPEPASKP